MELEPLVSHKKTELYKNQILMFFPDVDSCAHSPNTVPPAFLRNLDNWNNLFILLENLAQHMLSVFFSLHQDIEGFIKQLCWHLPATPAATAASRTSCTTAAWAAAFQSV